MWICSREVPGEDVNFFARPVSMQLQGVSTVSVFSYFTVNYLDVRIKALAPFSGYLGVFYSSELKFSIL